MKFYRDRDAYRYWHIIKNNKLSAIFYYDFTKAVSFFKNGEPHNYKNASYTSTYGTKQFYLNNKYCGENADFNKHSWRKFVKLQVFL
jgi:hypothetical protein